MKVALETNQLIALAMKQIEPHVVAAYPITPSTEVVQEFSQYVANGDVKTEFVPVESEHSAMSACLAASLSGARVMTATASQGLAFMWEMLHIAAASRAPIVTIVANRALSAPINIHGDHADAMGARDTGWLQLWAETAQEAYDNTIQAIKIAEDPRVRFPMLVNYDGFTTSHAVETVEILEDEQVRSFLGAAPKPKYSLLDTENPVSFGVLALQDYYMEFRRAQAEAYKNVKDVVLEVAEDYAKLTGRKYGILEEYKLDDADVVLVAMNSAAGTAKETVDLLRKQGKKVGVLKIRLFRPFPVEEIRCALGNAKSVVVMDRAYTYGGPSGPLFEEIATALVNETNKPLLGNVIAGLGGRDITMEDIEHVFDLGFKALEKGNFEPLVSWVGVRE
ncbi:transketolase C-terminal domain-containing protein [Coprothermobacter proteolyticus]|uniref:Pyruvate synthase subunit PorA (Pyruvate oxidoreductasealpha chain) (POR) (Pyruvic-ferredoxin oxidoreductase subunit alpha) n=1 Tax=Coprothermobacter proteolyticus (strain ATCC 35245 / DSM 5265 / OCM 4 / BT) TaxID=309798 RepID=B5Y9Q8_COPPD|nr:transketolase C-terminal domain-containing protein [Coprothermobacter proteolyticus]